MRPARGAGSRAKIAFSLCAAALVVTAQSAQASAPTVAETFSAEVAAKSARLHARLLLDPTRDSEYIFKYISAAEYEANLKAAKEGFQGAKSAPPAFEHLSSGKSEANVVALATGLTPLTEYRYRVIARNSLGTTTGPTMHLITQPSGQGNLVLPDHRGWEMVSPVDKNGGAINGLGAAPLQSASGGGQVAWSSDASFGEAQGSPPDSEYLSARGTSAWSTANLSPPTVAGGYRDAPHRLFSADLSRALLSNGDRCEGTPCPVPNPPLPGSGAPAGYRNFYLREGASSTALITATALAHTTVNAAHFEVELAGASPDLNHVVLESCASLTSSATEVHEGEGCSEAEQNLYEWSKGSGLSALNLLPAQSTTTPGAQLAAPSGAVSEDGTRAYFTLLEDGALYLREGSTTKLLPETVGGGATFQVASEDGSTAFFTKGAHLYRYTSAGAGAATDLTPSGGVVGVLGASSDGDTVYYQDGSALKRWHAGATSAVASGAGSAASSDYPPATGTTRVSADGSRLLFESKLPLTGFDNTDLSSGEPDSELFLYDTTASPQLACISCNPTNERPSGSSSVPGSGAGGYRPRALTGEGERVFFDSEDALAPQDTNNAPDVYQWEALGTGTCAVSGGCLSLVSSGKAEGGAFFADASPSGADVFFRTDGSLVPADPGAEDLYDAREGGGFTEPSPPLPCEGDACQSLPSEPC